MGNESSVQVIKLSDFDSFQLNQIIKQPKLTYNQATLNSFSNIQNEGTQNPLLNHYKFNNKNGKLKLNGTEVFPEEIRELLSNKNAQRVILQKAFESGWENISSEQEERFVQTIHHLAPFESSCGTISSDNMTLNRNEVFSSINVHFPMKNQQFAQQTQKMQDPHEESVQQSSIQNNSKFPQSFVSKGSSLNSNKNFLKNDMKNGSFSFSGATNALQYKGCSNNQSHRSNQSDSIMQFHCDEFGTARNNNQFNQQFGTQLQNCNNNSSRRNIFLQNDHECLTNIKETEDSIEKDYSQVEDLDIMTPEINFQISTNRNDNLIMKESKQLIQIDGEDNEGTYGQSQQKTLPNNSSVYQYQQGGQNGNQGNDVQKRYLNLEQLIRSRKSSKQMSDIFPTNVQDSFCGFQSPLNVELVRNFIALNESQLSTQNQGDLNPRQLEILRELVKEEHILKTIQKSLQSQQNSSRDILQNAHLSNNKQSNIQQQPQIFQQDVGQQVEISPLQNNISKQLQSAFEKESNDLPTKSTQIQKISSKSSTGLNTETINRSNTFSNFQNDQVNQNLNQNNLQSNIQENNQNQHNMIRQSRFQKQSEILSIDSIANSQQISCESQQKQKKQANNSILYISIDNISTKQKPNISVDSLAKKDQSKEQIQNKSNQVNLNKNIALQGDQYENNDNFSQSHIEGYSYRTQNSFKSNEQKKRSMSYNATGNNNNKHNNNFDNNNNNINNRSTSSFGFGNDDKLLGDTHFQSQNINIIPINGALNNSHIQSNLQNSMNLSGVQYKICSSINQENVQNPIKKIRSFSQNSRKANNSTQYNAPIQQVLKQNSLQNQKAFNNDSSNSNLFQMSSQTLEQNQYQQGEQIRLNQLNNQNTSSFNINNNNNMASGCQLNSASNKSIQDINNLIQNSNTSMNNSFNGVQYGRSGSGDCLNVNLSFERKFKKLRSISHQENRNSNRNSANSLYNQNQQQILNAQQQTENVLSQQNIQNQDNSLLNINQSGQLYQSFLNGFININTQFVSNTSNDQINQQQKQFVNIEGDKYIDKLSDITCKSNGELNSFQKLNKQIQQISCYDSINSQKSSGFKGIVGKENFDSLSDINKQNQNQIISFSNSNQIRFVTIQEQTENSNIPSMNSQQITLQNNYQTVISRQSVNNQQDRQIKANLIDNEKDLSFFSDIKSQVGRNSFKKQEIQNTSNINQNMGRNQNYFSINSQNDKEFTQNIEQESSNQIIQIENQKIQFEDDQVYYQSANQNQFLNNPEYHMEEENENKIQNQHQIQFTGENQSQQQLTDNQTQLETEYQFHDEQEETINQNEIEDIMKNRIENDIIKNTKQQNCKQENFIDFNKLIKCKNVQSISNTPLSKNHNDSNSSRIISRTNFQNQGNYKEMLCSDLSTLSPNIQHSQYDQGMQQSLSNSFILCKNVILEQQIANNQLTIDNNSPHDIQKDISQRSVIKIMNESHIQYTSKKKLTQPPINASYAFTPSKQVSDNTNHNEGGEMLITTPYELNQSKNTFQSKFIENQKNNQDNSLILNFIPPVNRSVSTDSQVNIFTNLDQSNDIGLFRKTIMGIRKNNIVKTNSYSNNNSFTTNYINSSSNNKNNEHQLSINSLNNQQIQYDNLKSIKTQQQMTEEDVSRQCQNSEQKTQINVKPLKSFSSFVSQRQKSENDQFDSKYKDQQLIFSIERNEIDKNNNFLQQISSQSLENTNVSLKESSIYLRNKNLIEQIKQNNKDIFKQTNNSQKQNDTQKEIEFIILNEHFKSEQKFENCNLLTIKKSENLQDTMNQFQMESAVKKQQSQISNREKQHQQHSDNKYKRSDLKLNDSIDFNKNQSENEDNEQYYMKKLNLNLNTYLTNESQEKLKELLNKAKQNKQNPQPQGQNNGKIKNQQYSQYAKNKYVQSTNENKQFNDEYITINQLQLSSQESLNKLQQDIYHQQQHSKINQKQTLMDHKRSKSSNPNKISNKLDQIEVNQSLQDLSQQDIPSQKIQHFSKSQQYVQNMKQKNIDNQLCNNNQLFQQQFNQYQSQTFQLDTFKQQYFEQEDQDGVIINEEEEGLYQNQNQNNIKDDTFQCITETSRKDNNCLDEINQQLMYLKQRSRNMDSSIQSEIKFLEDKVTRIFTKIKEEKQSKSKENSFMISLNHNSSNNNQINQLGSCQQSNSSFCHLQTQTKKNASATTASNSQTSSNYIAHQNQFLNSSSQIVLSQYNHANYLQPNLSTCDNNYLAQNLENGEYDKKEFFEQNNIDTIDQPHALEQPEAQFSQLSIETIRKNQQKSISINQNCFMKPLNNNNNSIIYTENNQSIHRMNQLQSCQFNTSQNQFDEPYEMNDEMQSNQQFISISGNKKHKSSLSQQQTNKKLSESQQIYQKKNFLKQNIDKSQSQQQQFYLNKQYQQQQIEQNDLSEQNYQDQQLQMQQQFADYFEQQVHENCLQAQELLEQSDSFYSSGRSNKLLQNQAVSKPSLHLNSTNQQNKNISNSQEIIQQNYTPNNHGGLTSCNTTNRSTLINNCNNNTNSNHSLLQVDRQKKDLELLKIMHILEDNPNNVISSIKQFETLDSQQIQNEMMLQLQSQREMEQQFSINQQMKETCLNQNKGLAQQQAIINKQEFQNTFQMINQNQQVEEQQYFQINKNQLPLFEVSQQEWQNISASFPNNSTNNNSQFHNKQSKTYQNNKYEDFVNQEQSYDNFEECISDQKINEQYQQQEILMQRQLGYNRVKQQQNNQYEVNDISDKENKIPEQKVNLMELLQKKQQQYQLQQKEQQKRNLQSLQDQNINIQLDFNTPIISTKSNSNHQNKFKNDQAEEDQVYIYPNIVEQMNKNMKQQIYQRNNHHYGKQYIQHTGNGNHINFTPEKYQNSYEKYLSSNQASANTSKTNTAKKLQNNCSSQKIFYQQNNYQLVFSDLKDDTKTQQRQKTHEKITQLYNQHKKYILKQEKINQEQDSLYNSSSNYWKIRNADSRKKSRNSSNSGPRSSGKERNNSKDNEQNPKYQLTEIVQFLNQQKKMYKPLLDNVQHSQNNYSQNMSFSLFNQQKQNNNKYNKYFK